MKHLFCSLTVLLATAFTGLSQPIATQTVQIAAEVVPKSDANKLRLAIQLLFRINGKNKTILIPNEGNPFSPESYTLVDALGNPIAVTPVIDKDVIEKSPPPLLGSISLYPARELNASEKYVLSVKPSVLVFQVGTNANDKVRNTATNLSIDGTTIGPALDYIEKRQSGKSKAEIGAGTPGGVAAIELVLDQSQFLHVDWLNLRLKANADFTLSSDDRRDFFNSLSAEGMFYRSLRAADNYMEFAASGRIESDQEFDVVNSGGGIKWAWFAKNKLTDGLGHIFVRDAVSVPPLIILSYDYVQNDKGSTVTPGTGEDHSHRGTAILRYKLPISKELLIPALGGKFDLSADFELRGVYDSASDKLQDQSWVSLVFEPSTGPERFKPAFSLTWARGKAPPTFEQVNAFFAGLGFSF
jgi:hypothetical protein